MAMGILEKGHFAVVEPDPLGSRFKVARLTAKGQKAQEGYHRLLEVIEGRWAARPLFIIYAKLLSDWSAIPLRNNRPCSRD
ncbi:MAG TPA: hypothetical protein VFA09_17650 [Ktedonobacteraceae bacterium]|jgi:hypothetical protein|nr:hypothetical protein [Ktedonobacteraceae bacterium]